MLLLLGLGEVMVKKEIYSVKKNFFNQDSEKCKFG